MKKTKREASVGAVEAQASIENVAIQLAGLAPRLRLVGVADRKTTRKLAAFVASAADLLRALACERCARAA